MMRKMEHKVEDSCPRSKRLVRWCVYTNVLRLATYQGENREYVIPTRHPDDDDTDVQPQSAKDP